MLDSWWLTIRWLLTDNLKIISNHLEIIDSELLAIIVNDIFPNLRHLFLLPQMLLVLLHVYCKGLCFNTSHANVPLNFWFSFGGNCSSLPSLSHWNFLVIINISSQRKSLDSRRKITALWFFCTEIWAENNLNIFFLKIKNIFFANSFICSSNKSLADSLDDCVDTNDPSFNKVRRADRLLLLSSCRIVLSAYILTFSWDLLV